MKRYTPLSVNELPVWDSPPEAVEALYQNALKTFSRKVIVLDDDPTGTQTVHDVHVYTDWKAASILDCFQDEIPVSYILTNSRSFSAVQTEIVHRDIAERICEAARQTGREFVLISRGDSTLRGHWPLETQTLADSLSDVGGKHFDGEIILPAFMEGGRFTFGGVHYVKEGERLIPAGESEFAGDVTFGYKSSSLADWCEEKSGGRYPADRCIYIALEDIRALNVEKIAEQLATAEDFAKIIVDAVCYEDLKVFCVAYVQAMQTGKEFLFRTAAPWVKVLGGVSDQGLLTRKELVSDTACGGIVLVGSYVHKTTRQLNVLRSSGLPTEYVEFCAELVQEKSELQAEVERVISVVETQIQQGTSVVVYTSRAPIGDEKMAKEERLRISVDISDAVTSIIGRLQIRPAFIVAKGGITSSDVGVKALRVRRARVMGQIMPGIPVWMTGKESKFPHMPYVIFPGNVGEDATLREVVRVLMGWKNAETES